MRPLLLHFVDFFYFLDVMPAYVIRDPCRLGPMPLRIEGVEDMLAYRGLFLVCAAAGCWFALYWVVGCAASAESGSCRVPDPERMAVPFEFARTFLSPFYPSYALNIGVLLPQVAAYRIVLTGSKAGGLIEREAGMSGVLLRRSG